MQNDIRINASRDIVHHDPEAPAHPVEPVRRPRLEDIEQSKQKKRGNRDADGFRKQQKGNPHPDSFIENHLARIVAVEPFHDIRRWNTGNKTNDTEDPEYPIGIGCWQQPVWN